MSYSLPHHKLFTSTFVPSEYVRAIISSSTITPASLMGEFLTTFSITGLINVFYTNSIKDGNKYYHG